MRIVGTDELGENKIASDLFKTITGNATLTVEYKNSNRLYSDRAQFTPIISTNSPPIVRGEDEAFKGRIVTVLFNQNLKSAKGDREQSRLYQDGRIACLAWLVEGCTRAIWETIRPLPKQIIEVTKAFNSQLSEIGSFITDYLEKTDDESDYVLYKDMLQQYGLWADENGIGFGKNERMSQPALTRALARNGIDAKARKVDKVTKRIYVGVKLKGTKLADEVNGAGK